ncbi:hypothetical protein TIFTF001_014100 [Ficus carica]|uniref:Uncharacterized protein n=1 Tax=Ficus carica TaxID=3494 RepID=A0AA88D5B0_FICCA|nr:hypothetical protein TIFTF001_014100 [Ficus carica]
MKNDGNIRDEYFNVNMEPPRVYDADSAPGNEGDVLDVPTLEERPNHETMASVPTPKRQRSCVEVDPAGSENSVRTSEHTSARWISGPASTSVYWFSGPRSLARHALMGHAGAELVRHARAMGWRRARAVASHAGAGPALVRRALAGRRLTGRAGAGGMLVRCVLAGHAGAGHALVIRRALGCLLTWSGPASKKYSLVFWTSLTWTGQENRVWIGPA